MPITECPSKLNPRASRSGSNEQQLHPPKLCRDMAVSRAHRAAHKSEGQLSPRCCYHGGRRETLLSYLGFCAGGWKDALGPFNENQTHPISVVNPHEEAGVWTFLDGKESQPLLQLWRKERLRKKPKDTINFSISRWVNKIKQKQFSG